MFLHKRFFAIALIAWLGCGAQYGSGTSASGASRETRSKVRTVATFDPAQSQLPEGIALDKEGNIYVGFYPTGQIWKITSQGERSLLATLDVVGPVGGGLVGFAFDEEGDLYVCDASGVAATHGIWKVDRNGATHLIANLDPTGFPNDLAFDGDGNLFVTDSYLGEIWKISKSGEAKVWLKSSLLDPGSPTCCYGANGIAFDGGYMFVANTDQGTIVRIQMGEKENGGPHAEVFVKSPAIVGADGIAFDVRHNVYVTADYQNTLILISPNGDIKTLATASEGLDFPADAHFGQLQGQRRFLFWTNGGYNHTKPSVQKLDVGVPGVRLP
jgi:sugar lactone lactonase YvrE